MGMTCEVLGVEYEFIVVNLMTGEHLKPEYLAINPQHNIPGFVDGDFHMNESRAIGAYLANAYAKDKSIYPEAPKSRAKVDQMMYFDMGQLYKAFGDCFYHLAMSEADTIEKAKYDKLKEVLGWAKGFIADTGVVDMEKDYPELKDYCDKLSKVVPNYAKANGDGVAKFGGWCPEKIKKAVEKVTAA